MRVWYTLFVYKNLSSVRGKLITSSTPCFCSISVPSHSLENLCREWVFLWRSWEYMLASMASNFTLTLWKSWTKIQTKFGTFLSKWPEFWFWGTYFGPQIQGKMVPKDLPPRVLEYSGLGRYSDLFRGPCVADWTSFGTWRQYVSDTLFSFIGT